MPHEKGAAARSQVMCRGDGLPKPEALGVGGPVQAAPPPPFLRMRLATNLLRMAFGTSPGTSLNPYEVETGWI
jgi:hypothetical protein